MRRSRLFFLLPALLISLLAFDIGWEIIRQNVPTTMRAQWPLRVSLLEIQTAATLLGVFIGLALARAQLALALRPTLAYTIDTIDELDPSPDVRWEMRLFNGGPGIATAVSVAFRIRFYPAIPVLTESGGWLELAEARRLLATNGISEEQYYIRSTGVGFPFVPRQPAGPGPDIVDKMTEFRVTAIARLSQFDVRVVVEDKTGDQHQIVMRYIYSLPDIAKARIDELRSSVCHPAALDPARSAM